MLYTGARPVYERAVFALFVLIATVLSWAALDALRKHLSTHIAAVPLAVGLSLGTLPGFVLWAVLSGTTLPEPLYWGWGSAAAICNVMGSVLLLTALRVAPISIVIPLLSLTPLMSAVLAWFILGELPEARQWFGMGLVLAGAATLGASGEGRSNWRGVAMGVAVATCFAGVVTLDKAALRYGDAPLHGLYVSCFMVAGLLALLAAQRQLSALGGLREHWKMVGLSAMVLLLAFASQLLALEQWLVSVVEGAKRAVGLSSALIVGRVVFGEPLTTGKLVAIGLMITGMAVLI